MVMRYVMGIAILSSAITHAAVQHISSTAQFDGILQKNNLVVAKFGAEWCGPCRASKPKFESMSNQFSSVAFVEIDVDNVKPVADRYNIESLPTFIIFQNGNVSKRYLGTANPMGVSNIEMIKQDINSILGTSAPTAVSTAARPVAAAGNVVATTVRGAGEVVETAGEATGEATKGVVESIGDFFSSLFR